MRTTVTLDPDVVRLLEEERHRLRKPFKQVLNDALRSALAPRRGGARKPYVMPVFRSRLRPGFDPDRMNQLVDELEDEAILARMSPMRRRKSG